MRIIEKMLSNKDVLEPAGFTELCRIIGQYSLEAGKGELVEGVSLLPVIDAIENKYFKPDAIKELTKGWISAPTEQAIQANVRQKLNGLRKKGFILTISDFKSACEHFCNLADQDFLNYNSQLKSLHRGYMTFIRNYKAGLVQNNAAIHELVTDFASAIGRLYTDKSISLETPVEFRDVMKIKVDSQIHSLSKKWYQRETSESINKEIDTLLTEELLREWQHNTLPVQIKEKLEIEKVKNENLMPLSEENKSTLGRLVGYYFQKTLPEDIQKLIQEEVCKIIRAALDSGKITRFSPLGIAYATAKKASFSGKDSVITDLIKNWHEGNMTNEASAVIKEYAIAVVENMIARDVSKEEVGTKKNKELEKTTFGLLFNKIAVEVFIENIKNNKYANEPVVFKDIRAYIIALMNQALLEDCKDTYAISQQSVFLEAAKCLHQDWLDKKLTPEMSHFVEEKLFFSLRESNKKVQERIWHNPQMEQSLDFTEIARLREEIKGLKKMIEAMKESLIVEKKPSSHDSSFFAAKLA